MSTQLLPSLRRILLLARMHVRGYGVLLLVVCGVLTVGALVPIKTGGSIWRGLLSPTWSLFFTAVELYAGTMVFGALRNPGLRLRYLTLPASAAEKLVAALLVAVSTYLMVVFVPLLTSSAAAFILNAAYWGYSDALFNPVSSEILKRVSTGISVVTFGMCAGLWVPKRPFLVAMSFLVLLGILYPACFALIFRGTLLEKYALDPQFLPTLAESSPVHGALLGSDFISEALWFSLPLAALYFRLKESDA